MKHRLSRVLRVRALLEDRSRLDFEKKKAEMRQLEMAADRQRQLALATRADAMRMLSKDDFAGGESWLMRVADAEILGWKERELKALAAAGAPAVSEAREEMMARRIERRQVEALLSSAARAEVKKEGRREQNRIDDWFQGRLPDGRKRG
jgi:hypothetical protein